MADAHDTFEAHYQRWQAHVEGEAVSLASDDRPYIDNAPYRAIVEMGWPAVPHIIEKLRTDEQAHFFIHALAEITGHRFTAGETSAEAQQPTGNQAEAARWLAWWDERQ